MNLQKLKTSIPTEKSSKNKDFISMDQLKSLIASKNFKRIRLQSQDQDFQDLTQRIDNAIIEKQTHQFFQKQQQKTSLSRNEDFSTFTADFIQGPKKVGQSFETISESGDYQNSMKHFKFLEIDKHSPYRNKVLEYKYSPAQSGNPSFQNQELQKKEKRKKNISFNSPKKKIKRIMICKPKNELQSQEIMRKDQNNQITVSLEMGSSTGTQVVTQGINTKNSTLRQQSSNNETPKVAFFSQHFQNFQQSLTSQNETVMIQFQDQANILLQKLQIEELRLKKKESISTQKHDTKRKIASSICTSVETSPKNFVRAGQTFQFPKQRIKSCVHRYNGSMRNHNASIDSNQPKAQTKDVGLHSAQFQKINIQKDFIPQSKVQKYFETLQSLKQYIYIEQNHLSFKKERQEQGNEPAFVLTGRKLPEQFRQMIGYDNERHARNKTSTGSALKFDYFQHLHLSKEDNNQKSYTLIKNSPKTPLEQSEQKLDAKTSKGFTNISIVDEQNFPIIVSPNVETLSFENQKNLNSDDQRIEQTIEKLKKQTGYLSYEIEMKLKTILGEDQDLLGLVRSGKCAIEDILSDDELNQIKYDPLKPVYDQIWRNINEKGGGYAKTLDFKLKEELIQRRAQDKWLSSRSKISAFNQQFPINRPLDYQEQNILIHPASLNIIEQPRSRLKSAYISRKGQMVNTCSQYGPLNNNDLQVYLQPDSVKTNEIISVDRINIEVIQFCSSLFLSWVEDYKLEAQIQKTRNKTEHLFSMNEAVEANIELNCIPIDYFLQRMFQIGLVTSLGMVKLLIETMLLLCNAGKAPDYKLFTSQNQLATFKAEIKSARSDVMYRTIRSSKMNIHERSPLSNKMSHYQTQNEVMSSNSLKNSQSAETNRIFSSISQNLTKKMSFKQRLEQKDGFVPLNYHNKEAAQIIRKNLDKWIFFSTNRVSIQQFISLFNIIGVGNAKKLDILTDILKVRSAQVKKKKLLKQKAVRDAHQKRINYIQFLKDENQKRIDASLQKKIKRDLQAAQKQLEIEEKEERNEIIELRKFVSPQQRKMIGDATKAIIKVSNINKTVSDGDLLKLINCNFSNKKDEQYYKSVIQDLRKISQMNQLVNNKPKKGHKDAVMNIIEDMIEQKGSKEQTNQLQGQLVKAIRQRGMMLDPNMILQLLDNKLSPEDFMEEYKKICEKSNSNSGRTLKDNPFSPQSQIFSIPESSRRSKRESYSKSPDSQRNRVNFFTSQEVANNYTTQDDKANIIQSGITSLQQSFDLEQMTRNNNSKLTAQTKQKVSIDRQLVFDLQSLQGSKDSENHKNKNTIDKKIINLRMKHELKHEFEKFQNRDNKYYYAYNDTSNQRDNLTKQQILKEICLDLVQTKQILCEMLTLDSTNHITTKLNNEQILGHKQKSAEKRTFTDREILNKRQQMRMKFNKYIMKDLVAKYARQAGVNYQAVEEKIGQNLFDGATFKMNMAPEDYGKMARQSIVKIALLMLKHKIDLNKNNFKDFCKVAGMERNLPIPTGIFGWQIELAEHEDIRSEVNKLVNLVLEQIKDRQSTFTFPNAEIEDLIEQGRQMWFNEVDKQKSLLVAREYLDNVLVDLGVVQDYKQVNRFLAGALSGFVIKRHETVTFTQFMKLIHKAALRDCMRNIISYHQFGFDGKFRQLVGTEPHEQSTKIGQQVMKLQRQILYQGVLSKNTIRQNEETKVDYLTYNQPCASIITNLQQLLQTPMIRNSDECKIKLEALIASLQSDRSKMCSEIDLHLNFDVPSEWNNVVFGECTMPNLDNIKYGINHLLTEYIEAKTTPQNLKLKAIALKKKILRKLIDKNYVDKNYENKSIENSAEQKNKQKESSGFYSKVEDLPQLKQMLSSNYENKHKQSILKNLQNKIEIKSQITHAKQQFSFGQPQIPILRDTEHFKIRKKQDRVSLVEGQLMASKVSLHMLNTAVNRQLK